MTTEKTIDPVRRGMLARLAACFRRFGRDREGATAIEFTLLAIPFSMLVFAILECCISFAAQEVMANATDDVARQIRTGQLLKANITEASLKKALCDRMEIMVAKGCPGLLVDLQSRGTFLELAALKVKLTGPDADSLEVDTTGFGVAPGGPLTKNMLRVFYPWPVMTDLLAAAMSNLKDKKTLHFATVTWQNEPFDN
jgi:Flp pilus assembly protein TadG